MWVSRVPSLSTRRAGCSLTEVVGGSRVRSEDNNDVLLDGELSGVKLERELSPPDPL